MIVVRVYGYRGAFADGVRLDLPRDLMRAVEEELVRITGKRDNHITYEVKSSESITRVNKTFFLTFSDFTCYIGTSVRGFDTDEPRCVVWEDR